ncbi:FR47-like protein [Motilibacter peucedani]|uniref:FR47-like protein n=1 Tax=Motilibacter peucedani TaxID=598650 RepID=A0A420XK52_9ACTN|nr:GNAT family N-acetyltransferase [Motilibacter peucedani]RKS68459.1 FR47-like protein [Motilibacter peucedani]
MTELLAPGTASGSDESLLDNAAWASLTGGHSSFAQGEDLVLRYPPDVSPFVAVAPGAGSCVWPELARLAGPGEVVALSGAAVDIATLPDDWHLVGSGEGVQLVATAALTSAPEPEAVLLGAPDVEEMLELVARTQPGPFLPRTYQLGTYLGIRQEGRLVAMAGERLHPRGWTEISAVCSDPAHRRRGLATRLVRAVAHGIRERGETPFMHAAATNVDAIRLYESIGFRLRRRTGFWAVRTPGAAVSA